MAFSYGLATFAAGYLVPVFLQVGLGHGAAAAGAALLPSGLALALASPWGGRLADRWPRHRIIAAGLVVFGLLHLPLLALSPVSGLLGMAACLVRAAWAWPWRCRRWHSTHCAVCPRLIGRLPLRWSAWHANGVPALGIALASGLHSLETGRGRIRAAGFS